MDGRPGDPWCADFVCTCLVKGYARAHVLPEDRSALPGYLRAAEAALMPLSGSCIALAQSAHARGLLLPPNCAPSAGALVLFHFRPGLPHHVGFVRSADRSHIFTVEGNTSSGAAGSQWDGDGVFFRRRVREQVFGFVAW